MTMAVFIFYFKLVVAIYILYNLIRLTLVDKREKNALLLFVVSFIVIVDFRNILQNTIPQSTVHELTVLFFLLYFLVRLLGENAKSTSLMRNFIDLKTLFDSEIIEKLSEGVALIKNDPIEIIASNSAYQNILGEGNAFITIQEVVSSVLRGEENIVVDNFSNQKRVVHVRLNNYGKRYALLYVSDISAYDSLLSDSDTLHQELIQSWENTSNLVMMRDLNGKITYLNDAMANFLHRSKTSLIGKPFSHIYQNEIEYIKHQDIHLKLTSEELPNFSGLLKITFSLNTIAYFEAQEQIIEFEGMRQIMTTGTDITQRLFLELLQSAYGIIHAKQNTSAGKSFVVADLINYDVLFKDQLTSFLQHKILSLGMFISGLSEEDQQYFGEILRENKAFVPKQIVYQEKHIFYVEQCIYASSGHLTGITIKYQNAEWVAFNQSTIGAMIVNHIKEGILIVNSTGKIEYANEMIQRILNYSYDELLDKNIIEISMGLTQEILTRNMELTKQHNSLHFERIYLTKEGIQVPTEVIAMNLEYEHADRLLLLIRDISEKFIYKKRLIDSQSRYAQIFETLQEGVLEIKLPEKTVNIYRAFDLEKGLIGYEIAFLQWLNSIHDQDRSVVYEEIDIITSEKSAQTIFEYRYFTNGGWQWYRASGKYIVSEEGASIVIINQNISEIKSVTQKLDESRLILTESERIANMAHWKFQVAKNLFTVSQTFGSIFLHKDDVEEIYIESLLECIYPIDVPYFQHKFEKFIWNHEKLDIIIRLHSHGKISFVNMIGQVYLDDENIPIYAIGSIADVTEKMLANQRFEESRTLLEQVVDQTPLGLIVIRNNGTIEKINQIAEKLLKIEEVDNMTIEELKVHLTQRYTDFDVITFEKMINSTVHKSKLEVILERKNTKLRISTSAMTDSDQHYLGRILNVVELPSNQ